MSVQASHFEIGSETDVGRRRKRNEDNLRVSSWDNGVFCVVADGMGGHAGGDVASRLAVEGAYEGFESASGRVEDRLRQAVERANLAVWQEAERQPPLLGMGTTLVCAAVEPGRLTLAHVGDSRAYLVGEGEIRQLTVDHSWVTEQVAAGAMTEEEAAKHPFRGVITRCVGCQPTVAPDVISDVAFPVGTALIVCSDGLTTHVSDAEILETVRQHSAREAVRKLIDLANSRGGTDNITIVIVQHRAGEGEGHDHSDHRSAL